MATGEVFSNGATQSTFDDALFALNEAKIRILRESDSSDLDSISHGGGGRTGDLENLLSPKSLKYAIEGWIVPLVSLVGLMGNIIAVMVLHHQNVKLKKCLVDILCGLAIYDNAFLVCVFFMFTFPMLSSTYGEDIFPYTAPYLLPATNTIMTCSVYSTVIVAINRFVEITYSGNIGGPRVSASSSSAWSPFTRWLMCRGHLQTFFVFVFSVIFNFSRWFELTYVVVNVDSNPSPNQEQDASNKNSTTETILVKQSSRVEIRKTSLKEDENYIRWYSCATTTIVMIVVPSLVMIYCTRKVCTQLQQATEMSALTNERKMARIKRNRSITRTLVGIICMFLFCHTGKIIISIYEVFHIFMYGGTQDGFHPWASRLIVINTLLVVINSSSNFAFYCGDAVFRQCLSALSCGGPWCWKKLSIAWFEPQISGPSVGDSAVRRDNRLASPRNEDGEPAIDRQPEVELDPLLKTAASSDKACVATV